MVLCRQALAASSSMLGRPPWRRAMFASRVCLEMPLSINGAHPLSVGRHQAESGTKRSGTAFAEIVPTLTWPLVWCGADEWVRMDQPLGSQNLKSSNKAGRRAWFDSTRNIVIFLRTNGGLSATWMLVGIP